MTSNQPITIQPLSRPVDATIELPGSKSYSNRALLMAALAQGRSTLTRALFSDDTRYMQQALLALGIAVEADEVAQTYVVEGQGGNWPVRQATVYLGNAGTATRFLTAALAIGDGIYVVDGSERMRQRPIQPLLDGLAQLGVDARSLSGNGCPPIEIRAGGIRGGLTRVRGDISSQYISAVLMAAPYAQTDVTLEIEGELVSAPYIDMTIAGMAAFGVQARQKGEGRYVIAAGQRYQARDYAVEPDASAASYFFAAAAVSGGRVRVQHLGRDSAQGDLGLLTVLEAMGCRVERGSDFTEVHGPEQLQGVEADFTRMGDVATTLLAIAPFAAAPVTVRGIAQTHYEESDRPVAAATELRRMGLRVEDSWDSVTVYPGMPQPAAIETYDDHRMAMSFAITGLRAPGIAITNPACVAKTFPDYFAELAVVMGR